MYVFASIGICPFCVEINADLLTWNGLSKLVPLHPGVGMCAECQTTCVYGICDRKKTSIGCCSKITDITFRTLCFQLSQSCCAFVTHISLTACLCLCRTIIITNNIGFTEYQLWILCALPICILFFPRHLKFPVPYLTHSIVYLKRHFLLVVFLQTSKSV